MAPEQLESPSRHELGQWFTPEPVADLALFLATGGTPKKLIVDPSCGDGVFLYRALHLGLADDVCGVDIDATAIAAARMRLPQSELLQGDFFDAPALGLDSLECLVGNPPYVRQERVAGNQKQKIVRTLLRDWPDLPAAQIEKLVAQGDMAAPFLLKCLHQLAPGGRAAFVLSSAFFDTSYGLRFWQLSQHVASLELVIDAPHERWFREAAVHTVIAVFTRGTKEVAPQFARLTVPTEVAAHQLRAGKGLAEISDLRSAPRDAPSEWASALRAPAAWLRFVDAVGPALVPLSELAEIRRGLTSGANDIFYIERDRALELQIDPRFLLPLLRAPGKSGRGCIEVDATTCDFFVLVLAPGLRIEEHEPLANYLRSFAGASKRTTLASRKPWWSLSVRPAQVFLSKAYSERFVQPFCQTPIVADQRVYCLHPKPGVDAELLAAVLNATSTALALESLGRASMGQGALEWSVGDAAHLPVIDPRHLADPLEARQAFRALRGRSVGKVHEVMAHPDQQALNAAVLGALADEAPALQESLTLAVSARLRRANA